MPYGENQFINDTRNKWINFRYLKMLRGRGGFRKFHFDDVSCIAVQLYF